MSSKLVLGFLGFLSSCHNNTPTKDINSSAQTSPAVAASLTKNTQTYGTAAEDGGPVEFGPCVITLRTSSITCDFDTLVYDSAKRPSGQHIFARQPQALRFTDDKNVIIGDGVGPEQFLVASGEGEYTAINAPAGGIRQLVKNKDGTFTAFQDGYGSDVYRTFDKDLRLTTLVDSQTRVTTTFKYNAAGLLEDRQDPRDSVHVVYNEQGLPKTITTTGRRQTFEISSQEQVIQVSEGGRPVLYLVKATGTADAGLVSTVAFANKRYTFTYENGALSTAVDDKGLGVQLVRDNATGRVLVKNIKTGHVEYLAVFNDGRLSQRSSHRENQRLTRDAYGRVQMIEDASGRKTSFLYDAAGHPVGVMNLLASGPVPVTTTQYNEFGQPLLVKAGPVTTTYSYDKKGRALSQVDVGPDTKHSINIDSFDDMGRPLTQKEETTKTVTKTVAVVYDALGNISSKTEDQGYAKTTVTTDHTAGTTMSELKENSGASEVQKKSINNVDQSVTEFRRTTDYAGRVSEITTIKTPAGVQKTEATEAGPFASTTYDAQGAVIKLTNVYTSDPMFSWAVAAQNPATGGNPAVTDTKDASSEGDSKPTLQKNNKKVKEPKTTTAH